MANNKNFDVIIVGGSYSGLSAGMALGRALKQTLIIDDGEPCNRQTPHSHNFITHDGKTPVEIATLAKQQVQKYDTIKFFKGLATGGSKTENGFEIQVASGEVFYAKKLIFATGIKDLMHGIKGYADCWGISVLHCPYCHGYEVKNEKTGIFGNGDYGFEFSVLISNWTKDLILFTNGKSSLTPEQTSKLGRHNIKIVETEIGEFEHQSGHLENILFKDGTKLPIRVIYARSDFQQNCVIPETLGCELNEEGYLRVDAMQRTNIRGVFACGDNTNKVRTIANSIATGTTAGMMINKEMIFENFK